MVTPAQNAANALGTAAVVGSMLAAGELASRVVKHVTPFHAIGLGVGSYAIGAFIHLMASKLIAPRNALASRIIQVISYAGGVAATAGLSAALGNPVTMTATAIAAGMVFLALLVQRLALFVMARAAAA